MTPFMPKYSYRIVKMIDDRENQGKKLEMNEYVVAESMKDVVELHCKTDLIDQNIEMVAIIQQHPIIAIVEPKKEESKE